MRSPCFEIDGETDDGTGGGVQSRGLCPRLRNRGSCWATVGVRNVGLHGHLSLGVDSSPAAPRTGVLSRARVPGGSSHDGVRARLGPAGLLEWLAHGFLPRPRGVAHCSSRKRGVPSPAALDTVTSGSTIAARWLRWKLHCRVSDWASTSPEHWAQGGGGTLCGECCHGSNDDGDSEDETSFSAVGPDRQRLGEI